MQFLSRQYDIHTHTIDSTILDHSVVREDRRPPRHTVFTYSVVACACCELAVNSNTRTLWLFVHSRMLYSEKLYELMYYMTIMVFSLY